MGEDVSYFKIDHLINFNFGLTAECTSMHLRKGFLKNNFLKTKPLTDDEFPF